MAAGKFLIKKTASGAYRFNLLATNGQVIATSENYKSLEECKNGVEKVRKDAASQVEDQTMEIYQPLTTPKYEVYEDKAGEYRFRLRDAQGKIIAVSEGYKAKASCFKGIDSVKRNAPGALLIELVLK